MDLNCISGLISILGVTSANGAGSSDSLSPSVKILFAAALLLVLVILITVIAVILRKHFHNKQDEQVGGGFLLSDLRKMHRRGDLTDEELEATKALIIKKSQQDQEAEVRE